jgi:hypothetical protein
MSQIRRRQFGGKVNNNDYITDGLVFHLDCADATTTEWVDKVGGYVFSLNGVSLDDDRGGVVFPRGAYGVHTGTGPFTASQYMIEAVFKFNGNSVNPNQGVFTNQIDDGIALGTYQYKIWTSIVTQKALWGFIGNNDTHTISVNPNTYCYINKTAQGKGNLDSFAKANKANMYIGCRGENGYLMTGTIYQIRIYDRALTEEEIFHNQDIDIKRYIE